jgi:hypothetical protein
MARLARDEARKTMMAFAVIALAALVERHFVMANPDVAWLLTVGEKVLDGARPYVDLLEINPPASIWLYMPFVWLGRVLHLQPERLIDVVFLAAAAASAWSLGRWPATQEDTPRSALRGLGFAGLAVLPAACFGEREHAVLILFLPLLALARDRAEHVPVSHLRAVGAGLLIGTIGSIKPHFLLPVLALYGTAAIHARSVRPLFAIEGLVGVALIACYVIATFVLYPTFWHDMMPILTALYLPARVPITELLYGSFPWIALSLVIVALYIASTRRAFAAATSTHLAVAALLGFLAAAVVQAKGYPYHFYPAFGLVLLLTGKAALDDALQAPRPGRLILPAITALFSVLGLLLCNTGIDTRPILDRMRAVAPHPRMASLASDLALGFPAVRELDGTWVGRTFSRWILYQAGGLSQQPGFDPAALASFRAMVEADRAGVIADLQAGRPTLIVVERRPFDFLAWAKEDPRLATILACYESADRVMLGNLDTPQGDGFDIELFRPRPGMTDPSRPLGCAPD